MAGRSLLDAFDAFAQVGRVLVAGQDRDRSRVPHLLRELFHHRLTRLHVVNAVEGEAFRLRGVAVEGHHRHAASDRVVDRAVDFSGIGAGDEDRVGAFIDRLGDALGLDLAVFGRRRQPGDLHRHAVLLRQLLGRGFRAGPRRQEHRIGRALRDHRDLEPGGGGRLVLRGR